jgi:hypothetical protein
LEGGNSPQIFSYVLFPDVSDWNVGAIGVSYSDPKDAFGQEDGLRVMPECPVTEIREECLGFVKPTVNCKIVFRLATEFPGAALRMFERMSHGYTS